jgi:hypothetical protein
LSCNTTEPDNPETTPPIGYSTGGSVGVVVPPSELVVVVLVVVVAGEFVAVDPRLAWFVSVVL